MNVDRALVCRLETSAVRATLDLVGALRANDRGCVAIARPFHRGALVVTGDGRYVNRALGISLDELSAQDVDAIEAFFASHHQPAAIELSPWAPPANVATLSARSYGPLWFRSMFVATLGRADREPSDGRLAITPVADATVATWLDLLARGNGIADPASRAVSDEFGLATLAVTGAETFLATLGDVPVGCGSLQVAEGVAWLGPAATVPESRGRGVQSALVAWRLRRARELGCDLAAATALPDGTSARNLGRLGFAHAQTQVVVGRPAT